MKIKKIPMVTQIVIAVLLGIVFGLLFSQAGVHLKIVGDIFLRLMQMAIPVLILGQIIQAVGGIAPKELTRLGGKTIAVFGISSLLAAAWGVAMAVFFTPGKGIDFSQTAADTVQAQEISPSETLINFIPTNIFDALSKGSIIQIIVFALFFGIALNRFLQKNPQSQLLTIIVDLNEVVLTIIRYVMILAPSGSLR